MERRLRKVLFSLGFALLSACSLQHEIKRELFVPKLPTVTFGRDFYGLQSNYWGIVSTNMYPMVPMATGNLDNTFGNALNKVDAMLSTLRPAYHRTHIINTTCVRNGNCGNYEIGYGYNKITFNAAVSAKNPKILNYVRNRVTLYRGISQKHPGTEFIISPALEHDLTIQSWQILADAVKSVWPEVQLSNSPDAGIPITNYLGAWIERHTNNFPLDADIVSLDGADATDINITNFRQRVLSAPKVKVALGWTLGDNCRVKQWIDPRQRKNCPSRQTFELMSHIMEPVPAAPQFTGTQCKKFIPFQSPDIWKPLAESYANTIPGKPSDTRQELPVLITNGFNKAGVNLLSSNGTRVGTLGFYGPYGAQFRWYSGYKAGSKLSGYEFQKRAVAASDSPYVWIVQNGVCKGPFVPGRRAGGFR